MHIPNLSILQLYIDGLFGRWDNQTVGWYDGPSSSRQTVLFDSLRRQMFVQQSILDQLRTVEFHVFHLFHMFYASNNGEGCRRKVHECPQDVCSVACRHERRNTRAADCADTPRTIIYTSYHGDQKVLLCNQSQKLAMSWLSVVSVPSRASANAILFACVQTLHSKRYVMKIQFIRNATPTVNTTKNIKLGMIY